MVRRDEANKKLVFVVGNKIKPVLKQFDTTLTGLGDKAVISHRIAFGRNKVTYEKKRSLVARLVEASVSPFTATLFCLVVVSIFTDIVVPILQHAPEDVAPLTITIIFMMVFISGILRFVQEPRSGNAVERLLTMITTTCMATRKNSRKQEILLEDLVVGDIIHLSAGDMVPADVWVLEAKDLLISQSALTGESDPIEKIPVVCEKEYDSTIDYPSIAFMGSSVISGSATAVAVVVGDDTLSGSMVVSVAGEAVETNSTKGVNAVSWVLTYLMLVIVPVVFLINGLTKDDWLEAFLFTISVAVGLTPEMLPTIVTTRLAKGVMSTSKKKTIVKNLNSIQNFGAMDVLCMDKTGTLTQDKVVLEYHMDVTGKEDTRVLRHVYLNSYFQTGYKDLMDIAIIERTEEEEAANHQLADLSTVYHKVNEIPSDSAKRRLSTVVEDISGKRQMTTKDTIEEVLSICSHTEYQGEVQLLTDQIRQAILKTVADLNEDGVRIIVIVQKRAFPAADTYNVKDECDMVLMGYLAFLDPPKESTAEVIRALKAHGVTTRTLIGDNDCVIRCIHKRVGLKVSNLLLGSDVERMSNDELIQVVESMDVLAKLSPDQKARVVTALWSGGYTVGFMGDGINNAAAMKSADIGTSVDTVVDIAKGSTGIILLEKDLMVLERGIIEGRKTYANMIKYIKMAALPDFGNMLSVLAALVLLPPLPMESTHLILLNLIYDLSCIAIPWDDMDGEFITVPCKWETSSIGNFMIWIGPTSSIFDWTTYAFLYFVFCLIFVFGGAPYNDPSAYYRGAKLTQMQTTYAAMFHAGWFVEPMWSQTLVIHMIWASKLPFIQSCTSVPVTLLIFTGITVLTVIPFTALGKMFGSVVLPTAHSTYLILCILLYMALATSIKKAYVRHSGELS